MTQTVHVKQPHKVPGWWWEWAHWLDRRSLHAIEPRPRGIPKEIPTWAYERYKLHRRPHHPAPIPDPPITPPPPIAPTNIPNPFSKVLFTAWDPKASLLAAPETWKIAVSNDPAFSDTVTPGLVAELKLQGYLVYGWEPLAHEGAAMVDRLGLDGWLGQAESTVELAAVIELLSSDSSFGVPVGIVGNPSSWTDEQLATVRGNFWPVLVECYWNESEQASPALADARGTNFAGVVYGCYPGARGRIFYIDYAAASPKGMSATASVYLAEEMDQSDFRAL